MKPGALTTIAVAMLTALCSCNRTGKGKGADTPTNPVQPVTQSGPAADQNCGRRLIRNITPKEKWAMNGSPETRAYYGQQPPSWLKLGKPVSTRVGGTPESVKWTRRTNASMIMDTPVKLTGNGAFIQRGDSEIAVPKPVADRPIHNLMLNEAGSTAAIRTSENGRFCVDVYDVRNGTVIVESAVSVPMINFDDTRRWAIQWVGWISDTRLLGFVSEGTVDDVGTDRVVLYLFSPAERELRRVALPDSITQEQIQLGTPDISIQAVCPSALLIKLGGAANATEHAIVLDE